MTELEKLRNNLFNKGPKEIDVENRICEIIEMCGGWKKFCETPMPIIKGMNNLLEQRKKEQQQLSKAFGGMGGKK